MLDPFLINKAYAKVVDGAIVEYPVFTNHILNRAEPIEWYTEVTYDAKPEVPAYHYAEEVPVVEGTKVKVSYTVKPLNLSSLLRHVNPVDLFMPSSTPSVSIEEVDPAAIDRIRALATIHVQERLDAFAQAKGYDTLLSCTSYKDSTVIQFSTEASIAIALRDQVWGALYTYFENVLAGTQPVPATIADIEAALPSFTWPQ